MKTITIRLPDVEAAMLAAVQRGIRILETLGCIYQPWSGLNT